MDNWNNLGFNTGGFTLLLPFILIMAFWEIAWKGWAMWKAAENKDTGWFVALLLLNTFGILPILYIYVFSKNKK
ncbi:MAG: DUF5652 family protein [Patescibacteria group bacterium]